MRRNAIARIIIWSLVILILLGVLVGVITYQSYRSTAWNRFYRIPDSGASSGESPNSTASLAKLDSKVEIPAADAIRKIEIDWASGNITVMPYDSTDTITFYEEGCTDPADAMVWEAKSDELKIQFWAERNRFFSLGKNLSKDLTILVPKDWVCEKLDLDTASTKLYLSDLNIREVDLDSASGNCRLENCTVDSLDIDSASGDVYFTGSFNSLDCDAASASVYAVLDNVPSRIDMDSASGDLDLTLPDDAGFTLTMDGLSNRFTSDFPTTTQNGRMISGNGYCMIEMNGMSGDVTIRKASSAASSNSFTFPAAPAAPTTVFQSDTKH